MVSFLWKWLRCPEHRQTALFGGCASYPRLIISAGFMPLCLWATDDLIFSHDRLELPASRVGGEMEVRLQSQTPDTSTGASVMGSHTRTRSHVIFTPSLPFLSGQSYQVSWRDPQGHHHSRLVRLPVDNTLKAPKITFSPHGVALPANALKFYLHFTEPMEQGVFLKKIRLLDSTGQIVAGPFRETELWSLDGTRLTVWFHPGRQKTGVNLNEEEGPVLVAGKTYQLTVDASWQSSAGRALDAAAIFTFPVSQADHVKPEPFRWKLDIPKVGSRAPLIITFDSPMDEAVVAAGLSLWHVQSKSDLTASVSIKTSPLHWIAEPSAEWQQGDYKLHISPQVEDLAGNNLERTFEFDLESGVSDLNTSPVMLPFSIR